MAARILVIEDAADSLKLISYLLRSFGYTVLAAADGEQGLEIALRDRPDIILCDIQLPKMSGYEVAARLKSDPSVCEIRLVAITALAMVGDRDRVMAAGFDGYIPKPINPRSFVREVEAYLEPHQIAARRSAEPRLSTSPPVERSVASNRAKILIVDDQAANRSLARSLLGPSGYEVFTASGGDEALAFARQSPPDLIVSDLSMDGGNGFQFIAAIRAETAFNDIPIIILTATFTDDRDKEKCLALGADRFITRPAPSQAFLSEVEACLREGRRN